MNVFCRVRLSPLNFSEVQLEMEFPMVAPTSLDMRRSCRITRYSFCSLWEHTPSVLCFVECTVRRAVIREVRTSPDKAEVKSFI